MFVVKITNEKDISFFLSLKEKENDLFSFNGFSNWINFDLNIQSLSKDTFNKLLKSDSSSLLQASFFSTKKEAYEVILWLKELLLFNQCSLKVRKIENLWNFITDKVLVFSDPYSNEMRKTVKVDKVPRIIYNQDKYIDDRSSLFKLLIKIDNVNVVYSFYDNITQFNMIDINKNMHLLSKINHDLILNSFSLKTLNDLEFSYLTQSNKDFYKKILLKDMDLT